MTSADDSLNFDSAAPAGSAGVTCAECKEPIASQYYEVGGQVVCAKCKDLLSAKLGVGVDAGAGKMAKAVIFGALAAALGAAIYLGVAIVFSLEIGLIAILVGWMVGKAVRHGSEGRGGRRYQLLAVGLTYFAISISYVPQLIVAQMGGEAALKTLSDSVANAKAAAASAPADSGAAADSTADTAASVTRDSVVRDSVANATEKPGLGKMIGLIALGAFVLLLIAPVKVIIDDFPGSALSAIIIAIGLLQAWRMNQRVTVEFKGPFKVAAPPPAAPANE